MAIQKLEEDVATYKAIADKAKEFLDESRKDADRDGHKRASRTAG